MLIIIIILALICGLFTGTTAILCCIVLCIRNTRNTTRIAPFTQHRHTYYCSPGATYQTSTTPIEEQSNFCGYCGTYLNHIPTGTLASLYTPIFTYNPQNDSKGYTRLFNAIPATPVR